MQNKNEHNEKGQIDELVEKLQSNDNFEEIDNGEKFNSKLKDKNSNISQLIKLLKNRDNQQYFLELCHTPDKITMTLFARILQKCSFVEDEIKQNNSLLMQYCLNSLIGADEIYYKRNNFITLIDNNNINNAEMQNICQFTKCKIMNHARDDYCRCIGKYKKYSVENDLYCRIYTYNNASKWFWPTEDGMLQRAEQQSNIFKQLLDKNTQKEINFSFINFCVGNYFGFDFLHKTLSKIFDERQKNTNNNDILNLNNNTSSDKKFFIGNTQIRNIIENGLFHIGAKDIAEKFLNLLDLLLDKQGLIEEQKDGLEQQNDGFKLMFEHAPNFFHKNGCKEFGKAIKELLQSEKYRNNEKLKDFITNISAKNLELQGAHLKDQPYIDDQLEYFKKQINELNNERPTQNTLTIHQANQQQDKVCCGCC